jgi:starch synthase
MVKKATGVTPKIPAQPLQILAVASEMYPFIKTGGLADVVGALPFALTDLSTPAMPITVTTLIPGYLVVLSALKEFEVVLNLPKYFGGDAKILRGTAAGVDLLVLDAPHLFSRAGNPYSDASGTDWQDNPERFAALALAAAMIGWGAVKGYTPDILHAHDWQAALAPAYLHYLGQGQHQPKTVLTIHNLAFQGQFPARTFARLGMPEAAYSINGVEYYGSVGYLKAGIQFAHAITTVSPTYAAEICSPQGGMGLDGLLRVRGDSVSGVVNGIDMAIWDPASDTDLVRTFDAMHLDNRLANKRAVEKHFNLPESDAPLFCIVSRLTWQKGIDLVIDAIDEIVATNTRIVVLGNGDKALEAALYAAVGKHPTHVGVHIGYDETISHLMQGGCDAILVPSRFEPCGLTQLYGLRYGCVPVVAKVGGLADTVIDANDAALTAEVATGIQFHDVSKDGLKAAINRAVRLYHQPEVWRSIQQAGMRSDVAWRRSAIQYAKLYRSLLNTSA